MMLFTTADQPKLYIRGNPIYHRLRNNIADTIDISNNEFYQNYIIFTKAISKDDRYYFKKSDLKDGKVRFSGPDIILTIDDIKYTGFYFKVSSSFLKLAREEIPEFKIAEASFLKRILSPEADQWLYNEPIIIEAKKQFNKVYSLLTDSEKLKLEFDV